MTTIDYSSIIAGATTRATDWERWFDTDVTSTSYPSLNPIESSEHAALREASGHRSLDLMFFGSASLADSQGGDYELYLVARASSSDDTPLWISHLYVSGNFTFQLENILRGVSGAVIPDTSYLADDITVTRSAYAIARENELGRTTQLYHGAASNEPAVLMIPDISNHDPLLLLKKVGGATAVNAVRRFWT